MMAIALANPVTVIAAIIEIAKMIAIILTALATIASIFKGLQ